MEWQKITMVNKFYDINTKVLVCSKGRKSEFFFFFFLQLHSFLDSSNSHLYVFFQSVLCLKKTPSSFHLESKEEL
jgi:hypothetical protein